MHTKKIDLKEKDTTKKVRTRKKKEARIKNGTHQVTSEYGIKGKTEEQK